MNLLSGANFVESPNYDERPSGTVVDMLVIHNISLPPGEYGNGYIEAFFQNKLEIEAHDYFQGIKDIRVSSHFCIMRDGSITQFVPIDKRAWHAGASSWQGCEKCNDYSIGIELEGTDSEPFTNQQYESLRNLTLEILSICPYIKTDRIVGHSDIAPGRKTDPGPYFDWLRYRESLAQ